MGKRLDLSGQRFGQLTAQNRLDLNPKECAWSCICDCGNEYIVPIGSLRSGRTKSCRACTIKREYIRQTNDRLDLVGKVYGELIVISQTINENKMTVCHCQCSCGDKQSYLGSNLQRGNIQTCGRCEQRKLIGKVFGDITVVDYVSLPTKRGSKYVYLCKCKCGKRIELATNDLKDQLDRSCRQCRGKNNRKEICPGLSLSYWKVLERGAKSRGFSFEIEPEYTFDILKKQNFKCALSGVTIVSPRINVVIENAASLDRIDSKQGYTRGNIQWVHKNINRLKLDTEENDFVNLCKNVARWHLMDSDASLAEAFGLGDNDYMIGKLSEEIDLCRLPII